MLLEGPAGTGKSSLILALRDEARAAAVQVCVAIGGELEREFPFGLVRQLLDPVLLGRDEAGRAALLTGAAAAAAAVRGSGSATQTGADGPFTTLHGLYWFVANLCDEAPLALLVDDAHWGDESSLRFLEFLARRAPEMPLLIIVAARPNEPGAPQDLLNALSETAGADIVRPGALTADGARAFVIDGLGFDPGADVTEAATAATGGNPLLLRELVRDLARDNHRAPTAQAVRDAVPSTVVRSVSRRLERLGPADRSTAKALALMGRQAETGLLAATTGLDAASVMAALEALRDLELVEGDPVRYVHPLVRAAVVESIAAPERIGLHLAAIVALRTRAADSDELIGHVLAVPAVGEPWVVDALRAAARRALSEGAPTAAVHRLRRAHSESTALGLPSDATELELGSALISEGEATAMVHLEAAAQSDDDAIAAEALRIVLGSGYYHDTETLDRLLGRAEAVATRLEAAGRPVPADRLQSQIYAMLVQRPWFTPRRRELLAATSADPPPDVAALLAFESFNRGDPSAEVAHWVDYVLAADPLSTLEQLEQPLAFYAMEPALGLDRLGGWEEKFAASEAIVRRTGSRLAAAFLNFMTADWALTTGSAASAEARARLAIDHFAGYGETTLLAALRGTLMAALIRLGRLQEADAIAGQIPPDEEISSLYSGLFAFNRRAELRLAQRRPGEAVAELRKHAVLVSDFGWDCFCQGYARQLLPRALVLDGQREEGLALAEEEVARARARGIPGAEAQALISLGHAVESSRSLEAFAAAHDTAVNGASSWVQALAAYELGAASRRAGHRTDARRHLTVARDLAERIDATLLADQAVEELVIAGGRPRRVRSVGVDSLTPAERRVAEHAAAGMSNREIAETLFVTRKTVELHLGNTFGKLGIRSRTQLAGILGGEPPPSSQR